MAEELSHYLQEEGLKVTYMHSEIETLQRVQILKELRMQKFDVLVGINLLREGLDLPEVSLVAILDADKEGFLRSSTSLIQVSGRCARHLDGLVLMYADRLTQAMRQAIEESTRRRNIQLEHNRTYHITPKTIEKAVKEGIEVYLREEEKIHDRLDFGEQELQLHQLLDEFEKDMYIAAKHLQFEKAAALRDKIKELKKEIEQKRNTL